MVVRFSALLDGEPVFDERISITPKARDQRISKTPPTWAWVGDKLTGLRVRGGQELVLRTDYVGPERMPVEELRLGFGGLFTESTRTRARTSSSPEQPNLVLVVMDTERADRCSAFGYEKATTPNLERLAARGVAFDDAWSTAPWTWPSTASLFTGLDALGHGVTSPKACFLSHELATLPKALQERGFTTGGFSCNPLISSDKNFAAGFEHFVEVEDFTPGVEVMPAVLDWVRARAVRSERFFLYLHLIDPHGPHRPLASELTRLGGERPADFSDRGYEAITSGLRTLWAASRDKQHDYRKNVPASHERWIQDVYDACVATGDHHLGSLLDLLDELSLSDETVIAYTSDHGEELFDHGLTDHAHTLHPELLRVPLVLAGPGIPRGERSSARVSNRHLASTLARFGAADLGVADAQDLARPAEVEPRVQQVHTAKGIWNDRSMMPIFGRVEDDWALHWASRGVPYASPPKTDPGLGQWQLFDRRSDPTEQRDVALLHPEVAQRMREELERWRDERARTQPKSREAGAATRSMLRGVGYVDGAEEDE
jgi:arylsulfatase A-like enzyme